MTFRTSPDYNWSVPSEGMNKISQECYKGPKPGRGEIMTCPRPPPFLFSRVNLRKIPLAFTTQHQLLEPNSYSRTRFFHSLHSSTHGYQLSRGFPTLPRYLLIHHSANDYPLTDCNPAPSRTSTKGSPYI